jgi:hypothetical protein
MIPVVERLKVFFQNIQEVRIVDIEIEKIIDSFLWGAIRE